MRAYADKHLWFCYGAPFDSTTSFRPGATILVRQLYAMKASDWRPTVRIRIKTCTDIRVFDSGDLELCFGNAANRLFQTLKTEATEICKSEINCPLLLGGEHLVTLAAVRAVFHEYPDLHIIHFDAHADLRDDYLGAKLSHACVLRRCHELLGDGPHSSVLHPKR